MPRRWGRLTAVLARSVGVRPAYLALDLLLIVVLFVVLAFLAAFWLPLALLTVTVALSLWLVRRYYLDDLDEPEPPRRR